eukprot:4851801-Prymnesium_polylepis.1
MRMHFRADIRLQEASFVLLPCSALSCTVGVCVALRAIARRLKASATQAGDPRIEGTNPSLGTARSTLLEEVLLMSSRMSADARPQRACHAGPVDSDTQRVPTSERSKLEG